MSHVISMKVMEKDQAQKQFDEARAQNKTAGQVKQVSKAPARGTDVFSISVNLAPRAAAYFTLTYQWVIFTLGMVRERCAQPCHSQLVVIFISHEKKNKKREKNQIGRIKYRNDSLTN